MSDWPEYYFGFYAHPERAWFAWRPVRLWHGGWAWLKTVRRRRVVKRGYLDGPDWSFLAYSD